LSHICPTGGVQVEANPDSQNALGAAAAGEGPGAAGARGDLEEEEEEEETEQAMNKGAPHPASEGLVTISQKS